MSDLENDLWEFAYALYAEAYARAHCGVLPEAAVENLFTGEPYEKISAALGIADAKAGGALKPLKQFIELAKSYGADPPKG